ncbi:MAG: DUF5696 domain-containing protein [Oscillospiraceae bacterium]|jgi:hypothetical protein|nr:DUF5696 domain-containing protein [Oscillospiraceae bacterium]
MMITTRKIVIFIIITVVLAVTTYQAYLTVRFRVHNGHVAVLSHLPEAEVGSEFKPLSGVVAPSVVIGDYVPAAENDILILLVSESTGDAAVYDKRDKTVVYSVPLGAAEDPDTTDLGKAFLQSQIVLSYFTDQRVPGRFNSYNDSVVGEQFRLESITDGYRVVYTIGDISSTTGIVPIYITMDRLEAVLAPLEGTRDHNRTIMRYVESTIAPGHMELRESVLTAPRTLAQIEEVFILAGYTAEDYFSDMEGSGVDVDLPLHFVIPLDIKLDGDSVVFSINTTNITETAGGRIERISIGRAFAAGTADETGYILVPSGSGSLIYFNNEKIYADEYVQYIYDEDPLLADYTKLGNIETAHLPFFGIKGENHSILARITSGETLANLTAGVAGMYNSYNYIYPTFIVRGSMALSMFGMTGNEAILPIIERDMPETELTIRYSLLPGDDNGYSAMAAHAREQLVLEGMLPDAILQSDDIPFYMNLVGSTTGLKFFAGVSYSGIIPLTTYEQAAEISSDLASLGIDNQVINYQGWFNRGYYHDVINKIKPVRQLGSKKQLEELTASVEARGGKLYSDTIIQKVPFSSKRFNWQLESSRYYSSGMVAGFGKVHPITMWNTFSMGYREIMYDVLSPRFITRYIDSYNKEFARYDFTGTSLRDMGNYLASDRKRTNFIDREQAKDVIVHNLNTMREQGDPLMLSGGNLYALGFADDLIETPLSHNAFYIVDEEVPFYQMVIHGRIPYAGSPINLSDAFNADEIVMRLIEFGASPIFAFTYEGASETKYTGLNWKYATQYQNWRNSAADIYHKVNETLSQVIGAEIVRHEILNENIRKITYNNGVEIVVNRSDSKQDYEGETLSPFGYIVKG